MLKQVSASFSALALLTAVSGCASLPSGAPGYAAAPTAPPGYATVYFYRVGAYPTLRLPNVFVAGVRVFEPPELGYTWVYVKAGDKPFKIEWSWDTKWPPVAFSRPLAAGESYYFKITGSFENKGTTHVLGSSARLVPAGQAEQELLSCCKYVKPEIRDIQ